MRLHCVDCGGSHEIDIVEGALLGTRDPCPAEPKIKEEPPEVPTLNATTRGVNYCGVCEELHPLGIQLCSEAKQMREETA